MRTIYKYELYFGDRVTLMLPEQYRILHVGAQGDQPMLWVEVDTDRTAYPVTFRIFGTGFDLNKGIEDYEESWHVGTWMNAPFVWHLYQIVRK